jgi:hypothetical protein
VALEAVVLHVLVKAAYPVRLIMRKIEVHAIRATVDEILSIFTDYRFPNAHHRTVIGEHQICFLSTLSAPDTQYNILVTCIS